MKSPGTRRRTRNGWRFPRRIDRGFRPEPDQRLPYQITVAEDNLRVEVGFSRLPQEVADLKRADQGDGAV